MSLVPIFAAAAIALVATGAAAETLAAKDNQCVACHEVTPLLISLGHSMAEWRASQHGRSGVTCEKCHGGDPLEKDEIKAHVGVLASTDPASKVSPRNLPGTCGSCHEKEYASYKSTDHAEQFKDDHNAATCQTCHGSMATSYPSPNEINARCVDCHDKPVQARAALSWLSSARTQLLRTRRTLDLAKSVAPEWQADAIKRFHEMEKNLETISLKWHTFDMESSIKESRDLLELGKLLDEEARLKIKMSKEPKK